MQGVQDQVVVNIQDGLVSSVVYRGRALMGIDV